MWVDTKSIRAPDCLTCASRSPTQPAAAEAGPPTTSSGCTSLTARAVTSYIRRYSARLADQNTSRLASFHTSNGHCRTSSSPYRATRCLTRLPTRSAQRSQSLGGETTARYAKTVFDGSAARSRGMNDSSTTGRRPSASTRSYTSSTRLKSYTGSPSTSR